jgi:hypothetical protein
MKKFVIGLWLSAVILHLPFGQFLFANGPGSKAHDAFNETKELNAILKVIEAETNSFFFRDYEGWKNQWVQADYVFHAWNYSDGSCGASIGWAEVDDKIGNDSKNNPVEGGGSSHPEVKRKNMQVRFFGTDVAHLVWEQYNSNRDLSAYNLSHEVRTMERINNEWKIVQASVFWNYNPVTAQQSE